jgi:hypothetical protein
MEHIRVLTQVTFQQIFVQQRLLKNVFAGPDNYVVAGNRGSSHNNLLASLICHLTAIDDSQNRINFSTEEISIKVSIPKADYITN